MQVPYMYNTIPGNERIPLFKGHGKITGACNTKFLEMIK
jgi:hypothetical protein